MVNCLSVNPYGTVGLRPIFQAGWQFDKALGDDVGGGAGLTGRAPNGA